jgi:hypothetical protein
MAGGEMKRYRAVPDEGSLHDDHVVYDAERGVWYKGHWFGKDLWVWAKTAATRFSHAEASRIADALENAAENIMAQIGRFMWRIAMDICVAVAIGMLVCAVIVTVRIIGQFVWGW